MGSNLSRRNHYIAKFIVRNFADASGLLHIFDKERGKLFLRKPKDAFVEKRRFVRYRDGGEQDDFEVEDQLGKIESAAAPAIRRIIASARKGDFPKLSPEHQRVWKQFFFTSHLRTPRNAAKTLTDMGSEKAIEQAFDRVLQERGLPTPDEDQYGLHPQWTNAKEMFRHNVVADLAIGQPRQVNNELASYSGQVGLLVGVIQDSSIEFVLGSCAGVVVPSQAEGDLTSGTWLPIAYDVAIGLTEFPDREYLRHLSLTEVQRINNTAVEQSQFIAARSQVPLKPFIRCNSE